MSKRVFVLMLDGADENTVGRLLREGRMPVLASIAARGTLRTMDTGAIPITPGVFSAMLTGMNAGRTGVLTFETPANGYRTRIATAIDLRGLGLHERLAAVSKRMISIAVPMTSPPTFTDKALIVAGWDAMPGSPICNDAAWSRRAADLGYRFEDEFETDQQIIAAATRRRFTLASEMLTSEPWDCFAMYFGFVDSLSHRLGFGNGQILSLLELVDTELANILPLIGDAEIIVCSDHGFGQYPQAFSVLQWLESEGYLALRSQVLRGSDAGGIPGIDVLDLESGAVDWANTRAFCYEATGNAGAIRINSKAMYPAGAVHPAESYTLAGEIIERLRDLRDALGNPVVTQAWRREELFWGARIQQLPEIVFHTNPSVLSFVGKRHRVNGGFELDAGFLHDGAFDGHLPEALWCSSFDVDGNLVVQDVAATIYALLGVPIPADVDGVNRSLFPSETTSAPAIESVPLAAYSADEEETVRKRLEALGYL